MYSRQIQLFIDGQWSNGSEGDTSPIVNPATGEQIASLDCASPDDLDRALGSSARAFAQWKTTTAIQR